jgi:hypothetical protein
MNFKDRASENVLMHERALAHDDAKCRLLKGWDGPGSGRGWYCALAQGAKAPLSEKKHCLF